MVGLALRQVAYKLKRIGNILILRIDRVRDNAIFSRVPMAGLIMSLWIPSTGIHVEFTLYRRHCVRRNHNRGPGVYLCEEAGPRSGRLLSLELENSGEAHKYFVSIREAFTLFEHNLAVRLAD
jgi:hypothetical protein